MIAALRRLIGADTPTADESERERKLQYEHIREGLKDAAQRIRMLEIEAELRARSTNIRQNERDG